MQHPVYHASLTSPYLQHSLENAMASTATPGGEVLPPFPWALFTSLRLLDGASPPWPTVYDAVLEEWSHVTIATAIPDFYTDWRRGRCNKGDRYILDRLPRNPVLLGRLLRVQTQGRRRESLVGDTPAFTARHANYYPRPFDILVARLVEAEVGGLDPLETRHGLYIAFQYCAPERYVCTAWLRSWRSPTTGETSADITMASPRFTQALLRDLEPPARTLCTLCGHPPLVGGAP